MAGKRAKSQQAGTEPQAESAPETDRQSGGVQSIGRAFAILEQVARARQGIRLAELSKRVGLHNSTTFHLVQTMASLGYIRKMPEDKSYRIGRKLFTLAASALDETEMVSLATPILEDLARESGESSHFSVKSGDVVVVLSRITGPSTFQYIDRAGVSRPAYATALGKVLLAALQPEQLDQYLKRVKLERLTPQTIVDPGELRQALDSVRTSGVAFDDCEFDSEARCVAVPVRDFSGRVIGATGISGPVWRMSLQLLQKHTKIVEAAGRRISAEFGYEPDRLEVATAAE